MSTEITAEMTPSEARASITKVHETITSAGAILLDLRDRMGWKALGYSSWEACVEKEFDELKYGRRKLFYLVNQAEVSKNLGKEVPERHAREIHTLPPEEQKEVYKEAEVAAAPAPVTAKHVREAAEPRKSAAPVKKPEPSPALVKSLKRIESRCGKDVRTAIENGSLPLSEKDILQWAAQSDERMNEMQELIIANRWTPARVIRFLDQPVDENTKLVDMINFAIAEGGRHESTINGFRITIEKLAR
jgi:hypothetical protein